MSSEVPRLLIRADADSQIGTGHVMRCLALAQSWLEHCGPVTLLAERLPNTLEDRLVAEGVSVQRLTSGLTETVAIAQELRPVAVVIDGYHFTSNDEQQLHEAGFPVLAIDDFGHTTHTHATWVLNQNLGALDSWYATRGEHTQLLLGPRYALLRPEFAEARTFRRVIPVIGRKILVTMGGADPNNITALVLQTLATIAANGFEIIVVVGGSNPHRAMLEELIQTLPHQVELRHNVSDMPALMKWAELAITAGGTTCWELATFGVPMVVLILADNQVELAKAVHHAGLAINLGWPHETTVEERANIIRELIQSGDRRSSMSSASVATVDGWGVTRVVQTIQPRPVITLRPARSDDCRILWEWANHPSARSVSFNKEIIPWETHTAWFQKRLASPACLLLIAHDANAEPIGMIRFDQSVDQVVVSVFLAEATRGKGFGTLLIRRGSTRAIQQLGVSQITAWILPSNPASLRTFQSAGYRILESTQYHGQEAYRLIFEEEKS